MTIFSNCKISKFLPLIIASFLFQLSIVSDVETLHISLTRLTFLAVIVMLNVDLCIFRNFVSNACAKCTCTADCKADCKTVFH